MAEWASSEFRPGVAARPRAYEIVLREGTPSDEGVVDGVLLCEAWPDLVLPAT